MTLTAEISITLEENYLPMKKKRMKILLYEIRSGQEVFPEFLYLLDEVKE